MSSGLGLIGGIAEIAGAGGYFPPVYHTTFTILIGGVDVGTMQPPMSMLSLHYEELISFQADTLEIVFSDIGDSILLNPAVDKGKTLQVIIDQFNKFYPGNHSQLDTGTFQIDQIKQIGPPTQTTLMATTCPTSGTIKYTLANKVIPTIRISDLGQKVATDNGMKFDGSGIPVGGPKDKLIGQVDQWNETELMALSRVCRANGLAMTMKNNTLYIFDEQKLEERPVVYTLDFNQFGAIGGIHWDLTTQDQDIYSQATFENFDPATGQKTSATTTATNGTSASGESMNSWDTVDPQPQTQSEQQEGVGTPPPQPGSPPGVNVPAGSTDSQQTQDTGDYSSYLLRSKNIREFKTALTFAGMLQWPNGAGIESGTNVQFLNKGSGNHFLGKWIIQGVKHYIADGKFLTDVDFRRCIIDPGKTTLNQF
jgi:phage protein D